MWGLVLLFQAAVPAPVLVDATEVVSRDSGDRTLTVYRDDLAFVTERRLVDLPAGRSRVVFAGVSDRMVPQTAVLAGFDGVTLERNFDHGLLTDATFYESMVGQTVTLRRTDAQSGAIRTLDAEVLAAREGLIVRTGDGVEALACGSVPQALLAPERPAGLVAEPELSVIVDAPSAGARTLSLAYLADGVGWSADYVLTVANDADASLRGWLTFTNETATSYTDVPTAIVAGTLRIGGETTSPQRRATRHYAVCWPQGTAKGPFPRREASNPYLLGFPDTRFAEELASPAFAATQAMRRESRDEIVVTGAKVAAEERFGDYRLYRPPGLVSLTPYRTKQIAFLDEQGLAVMRRYDVALMPWDEGEDRFSSEIVFVLNNEAQGPLGRALPAGTVRVMTTVGEEAFYLGQDDIRDLAVGLPVEIVTGDSASVWGEMVWTPPERSALTRRTRRELTVTWSNELAHAATVRLTLPRWIEAYAAFDVDADGARRLPAQASPTFEAILPAGGRRTVKLALSWRDR